MGSERVVRGLNDSQAARYVRTNPHPHASTKKLKTNVAKGVRLWHLAVCATQNSAIGF
jgi:hypothetical protein